MKGIKFPIATATTMGGVKLSEDFTADEDGTLHLAGGTAPDPYPVGIVISMVGDTSPAALFGGAWEEIASERVLMGASSTHAAGTTVEAGLPNIKFSFTAATVGRRHQSGGDYSVYGASSSEFNLDASKSNAIYGASNTVQPAAYYVHIWRRVA